MLMISVEAIMKTLVHKTLFGKYVEGTVGLLIVIIQPWMTNCKTSVGGT